MPGQRLIDYNPLTGEYVTFEYNEATDQTIIGHHQDIEPILESNKAAMSDTDKHKRQSRNDWAHYATVPNLIQFKWLKEDGINFYDQDHWPAVMKKLNDPDYRYLKRTTYKHDR